jgi:transposase
MRGEDAKQSSIFSIISPERRVPQDHPLRVIKAMTDAVLRSMSKQFDAMYSKTGRPSIPPERLLKAQLLIALYSIRSARMFCEQLDYNLLFRWFLDMNADDPAFDHSSFTKNSERLLKHDVAGKFFAAVVDEARARELLSSDHFRVDGTLIEAWASLKSFRPKDEKPEEREPPEDPGNPTVNFHGEKRRNDTHASTTDPEAKLARKGNSQEAKLCFSGHALMENRNGLLVDFRIAEANGTAERDVALAMLEEHVHVEQASHVASSGSRPTWRPDRSTRQSTAAPRGTRATRSASGCANASRRSSAGPRRSVGCDGPGSTASSAHSKPPTSSALPTTCSASRI